MLRNVTGRARLRQLQLATGGRYKPYLVEKIVEKLKSNYLDEKKKKLSLKELLALIEEKDVSDDLLVWLAEEALPDHPRVSLVGSSAASGVLDHKFTYNPPLKITGKSGLVKLLKQRYEKPATGDNKKDEVGLLRSLVSDSISVADRIIQELVEKGEILEVIRLDRQPVLFYKKPEVDLDKCCVDQCFIELWRNVDVSSKEMPHIKEYLKNRGLPTFTASGLGEEEEENTEDEKEPEDDADVGSAKTATEGSSKGKGVEKSMKRRKLVKKRGKSASEPKPKKRRSRRTTVFRDNAHLKEDLMHIDID